MQNASLRDAVLIRCAEEEHLEKFYTARIEQLNTEQLALLQKDLGSEFIKTCGHDLAGEVVRNFFNTGDFNITVDQLARRIMSFSYDDEYDPLSNSVNPEQIRKNVYNQRELWSSDLDNIQKLADESREKLFTESRSTDRATAAAQKAYRESQRAQNGGIARDELTGAPEKMKTRKDGVQYSDLHADHTQARETARVVSRYLVEEGKENMRKFYNSEPNMQLIHASANTSKGDVRVCKVNGEIKFLNARSAEYDPKTDITDKATAEQLADATISQWEKVDESRQGKNNSKTETLKRENYLGEDGKVDPHVRKKLISKNRFSQNAESIELLKNTKYENVASDAADMTKAAIGKILAGQIIYYAAPPLIYEVRDILKADDISLDNALEKLGKAGVRIGNYLCEHLGAIFENVFKGGVKKFIKSFMDILINMVKETVKKLFKIAKSLVMSTVDAIYIIADKSKSPAEKADAVFALFGTTITTCAVDFLFEYLEKAVPLPEFLWGPLQILTTVLCTNLVMLVLKEMDLFHVREGFQKQKIQQLFIDSRNDIRNEIAIVGQYSNERVADIIRAKNKEIREINILTQNNNMSSYSAETPANQIIDAFSMDRNKMHDQQSFLALPSD